MIQKIADKVIDKLLREKLIQVEQRDYYIYALVLVIERWMTIATIMGISIVKGTLIQTILFLLVFLSLRKHTGGFHATKFWKCYIGTVVTYFLITVLCPIFLLHIEVLIGSFIFSVAYIAVVGTINHPNMELSNSELEESKRVARYTLIMESLIIVLLWLLKVDGLCIVYMTTGIIVCASLLGIAKLIKQEVRG